MGNLPDPVRCMQKISDAYCPPLPPSLPPSLLFCFSCQLPQYQKISCCFLSAERNWVWGLPIFLTLAKGKRTKNRQFWWPEWHIRIIPFWGLFCRCMCKFRMKVNLVPGLLVSGVSSTFQYFQGWIEGYNLVIWIFSVSRFSSGTAGAR